ncbi:hypothetical protein [Roseisolibacter agri]|uniref:Uncharacterized protein n=1 Tax=Roseisolibacter agri TaxID=2014610 RepID=A0AA37Q1W0_9BACT|nr:hypothetical protein [Roseisolibacter agri]GLC25039.1 hypothetical protein rosag_15520 [Roseisolibacter agri]
MKLAISEARRAQLRDAMRQLLQKSERETAARQRLSAIEGVDAAYRTHCANVGETSPAVVSVLGPNVERVQQALDHACTMTDAAIDATIDAIADAVLDAVLDAVNNAVTVHADEDAGALVGAGVVA